MKHILLPISLTLLLLCAAPAPGQRAQRKPEIGYLYPAGARQGTVVRVLVGGQMIAGLKGARVSGTGVHTKVVRYMGRFTRLNGQERKALKGQLKIVRAKLASGEPIEPFFDPIDWKKLKKRAEEARKAGKKTPKGINDDGLFKLRRHPLLSILHKLTLDDLKWIEYKFLKRDRRLQLNAQIDETAMIEVTVDGDARPGDRTLRLVTNRGLTNAMCFQVGQLSEFCEPEPADTRPGSTDLLSLPVLLNGQITPGDADRFRFLAEKGQKLVIRTSARQLKPFLADAVPGWFQAVLTLKNEAGREIAYGDDFRFDPDPVLYFEVPETGTYSIEIHDAIYRGRDDFVYRISISEQPFIKSVFPLGGRIGSNTVSELQGWNLSSRTLGLETGPSSRGIRVAALNGGGLISNPVTYAVDDLPEILETEGNNTLGAAMAVSLPVIVNGRIDTPQDLDLFKIQGRAGDRIVAEVAARRLRSPLDSLLRLKDGSGKVLAWNDDSVDKQGHLHRRMGVLTHHADSYLQATLPADGEYWIELSDTQGRGGGAFAYRLRLSKPRGDFDLHITPSTINLTPGRSTVIQVHAIRKDGFAGEIKVAVEDPDTGFSVDGDVIPPGRDHLRMTLTAPSRRLPKPVSLTMEGTARVDGKIIHRKAIASDNVMQAFLWRHLVPSRELVVAVSGRGGAKPIERVGKDPLHIPPGGSAPVVLWATRIPNAKEIRLELDNPPKGVTLTETKIISPWIAFIINVDDTARVGTGDNLIINVILERATKSRGGKGTKIRRFFVGNLPAIPVRIIQR